MDHNQFVAVGHGPVNLIISSTIGLSCPWKGLDQLQHYPEPTIYIVFSVNHTSK